MRITRRWRGIVMFSEKNPEVFAKNGIPFFF
jgi:hypothetical protein